MRSFRIPALAGDALALASAFGYHKVAAVVGHDFGSSVAAWCALARPDVFRSVVMMSAPFAGPRAPQFGPGVNSCTERSAPSAAPASPRLNAAPAADIHAGLAMLDFSRKHYQWYYATSEANENMRYCPQGVHDFLRAYYHYKSADWTGNRPFALATWSAAELAKLPTYYVMHLDLGMAETVAPEMPSSAAVAACEWLSEDELRVYSTAFEHTGFQGGLQWYRSAIDERLDAELGSRAFPVFRRCFAAVGHKSIA